MAPAKKLDLPCHPALHKAIDLFDRVGKTQRDATSKVRQETLDWHEIETQNGIFVTTLTSHV